MKRISIGLFITFIVLLVFSACQENVYVDWKIANDQWFAKHQSDSGFVTSATGLTYKIIYHGWDFGRQPNSGSNIKVSYKGSLIDGTIFDSNSAGVWLSLPGTIAGWREIIPKLRTGASVKLYIPSALAYDTVSTNPTIPPHSVLIFDVNLLDSYN
jgi:FKBP-type peptidyl-prolyl cis-trans isomerase